MQSDGLVLLDGAVGTELERRGFDTAGPAWTARACDLDPALLAEIHRDYAAAGATVHTANTFRTTPRGLGPGWRAALRRTVSIARGAVPPGHLVAGSLAPLEDCWHPERSPPSPDAELAEIAVALREAGADLVSCETFAHPGEALAAVRAGVSAGLPTWLALTAGPRGDLLSPDTMVRCAGEAVEAGAACVLVNCVPAASAERWLRPVLEARLGVPIGVYPNAGDPADGLGWGAPGAAARYAALAARWCDLGATRIGGCCGTGPAHIAAIAAALRGDGALWPW